MYNISLKVFTKYRIFSRASAHLAFAAADEQFTSSAPLRREFFYDNILLRNTRGYLCEERLGDFVFGDFEPVFLFCLMFWFSRKSYFNRVISHGRSFKEERICLAEL